MLFMKIQLTSMHIKTYSSSLVIKEIKITINEKSTPPVNSICMRKIQKQFLTGI